jgi:hypothetical protein
MAIQNALDNLKASLTRVRDIAADIDAHAQCALADKAVQARHDTTLYAAAVILSGFLESFLREVAEEMITEICSRAIPFHSLPSKIRATHYWEGGEHLRDVARKERKEQPLLLTKAADVARRLASVASTQGPYEILWEAFADTQANPGSKEIGEFLSRFDVEKPIPTLAAAMNWTENTVVLRLESFIRVRNECAHTGATSIKLTTTDLTGYCDLIDEVGGGVVSTLLATLNRAPYVSAQLLHGAVTPAQQPTN